VRHASVRILRDAPRDARRVLDHEVAHAPRLRKALISTGVRLRGSIASLLAIAYAPTVTLHELLDKAGLSARTLRHWTQKGLMPRATDGRYTDADLVRALVIWRLRNEDGVHSLEEVARRLEAMSFEEMDRYVMLEGATEGGEDEALEATTPILAPTEAPIASIEASRGASDAVIHAVPASIREEWAHVTLRDGLVLLVRQPASREAASLARKIATISDIDASFD
jgi:DNA-binding transcriptional MerR regulator